MAGVMGGFFEDLGWKGAGVMLLAAIPITAIHAFGQAGMAKTLDEESMSLKPELATAGVIALFPVVWGLLRAYTDIVPDNATADVVGNIMGAALIYEGFNVVEELFEEYTEMIK